MTLKEAVVRAEQMWRECIKDEWPDDVVLAFRLVIDVATERADDTAEIVLPKG